MTTLPWITDDEFDVAINNFISGTDRAIEKAAKNMVKNVIDPFSSLSLASTYGTRSAKQLKQFQTSVAATRAMDNPLGNFHHDVLSCVQGWEKNTGYDLKNTERQMLAEIKNKHNTLNDKGRYRAVDTLKQAIKNEGHGWRAYLVLVIPKKPVRYEKELSGASHVYETDGASFYAMATGHDNALQDMFTALMQKLQEKRGSLSQDIQTYCVDTFNNAFGTR